MNERTKDLLPNPFAVDYQYKDGPLDLYTEKEMFRFAKLVAQECIQIVTREANTYSAPVWAYEIVNDIAETFGIDQ